MNNDRLKAVEQKYKRFLVKLVLVFVWLAAIPLSAYIGWLFSLRCFEACNDDGSIYFLLFPALVVFSPLLWKIYKKYL